MEGALGDDLARALAELDAFDREHSYLCQDTHGRLEAVVEAAHAAADRAELPAPSTMLIARVAVEHLPRTALSEIVADWLEGRAYHGPL